MEKEKAQHEEELWGRVFSRENLYAALERVQKNGGAPGVDGMTVEELGEHLREHWESIRGKLEKGRYRPSPVKRVEIPKPGGGKRQLGIPTVLDRMIQQALQQVLSEEFEETFSDHNYGFRPGRSAHEAVEAAREYIEAGYRWVVDIDLEKFFDKVNHDTLMSRVARRVKDRFSQSLAEVRLSFPYGVAPKGSAFGALRCRFRLSLGCRRTARGVV